MNPMALMKLMSAKNKFSQSSEGRSLFQGRLRKWPAGRNDPGADCDKTRRGKDDHKSESEAVGSGCSERASEHVK